MWLRNEDAALKYRLQGLTVTDATAPPGGRPVGVRYRLPRDELAALTYPVLVIQHAGMYPAEDRMHSGTVSLPYAPEGYAPWWDPGQPALVAGSPYTAPFPMPWNLDYTVTLYARFWGDHVVPLLGQLARTARLPPKGGELWVPQDGTSRTMMLLGGPEQSYGEDEDGKRLLTSTWRVRVFAELAEDIQSSVAYGGTLVPVNAVNIDLDVYASMKDIDLSTPAGIAENIGILSAGASGQAAVEPPPGQPASGEPA